MRKHFLILMLMALLPLAGWSEPVLQVDYSDWTVTLSSTYSTYDGTPKVQPTITLTKEGQDAVNASTVDGLVITWNEGADWINAGTNTVTVTSNSENVIAPTANTATYTIAKKQVVYFLTGGTYAVGDEPDITRHYSLANPTGAFAEGEELSDYASFDWADTGNDKLDLVNGRFTTIKTYNIAALRVIEKPAVHQNYDFRFTSTAVIVVTAKSIAGFVADAVADQQYTGKQIKPAAVAIYATVADQQAETPIALNPETDYTVEYGDNVNVGTGTIIYTGTGNYEGTLEVPFNITKRELVSVTVEDFTTALPYAHGAEIEPTLTVTGEDEDGNSYTLAATDYTVDYNGTNINVSEEGATGELEAAEGGNFTFAEGAELDDATFMIAPKDLGDEDITIAEIDPVYYTAAAIEPQTTVSWTIGENAYNITDIISFEWNNNTNAGTAAITAKVNENAEGAENYTGTTSANFMILPTSIDLETITIQLVNEDPADEDVEEFTAAEYKYLGRPIQPGVHEDDAFVLVKDGDAILKKGVDYEIVAYTDAAYEAYDNVNANENAAVIIKGKGNYGRITALAEPITKIQNFEIGKKTLELKAVADRSTTYGVSPIDPVVKFDYNDNTDEDAKNAAELLGGYVTYELYSYDPTADEPVYDLVNVEDYTTLAISGEHLAYVYKPVWNNLPNVAPVVGPDQPVPVAGVDYKSEAQIAARLNYDLDDELSEIVTESALFTVNAAKWIIVPDAQTKKYGVADGALTFTYKVYNGSVDDANLVEEPVFDKEPKLGRAEDADDEDVKTTAEAGVYGTYAISVLNANGAVTIGETEYPQVAKAGYTIECQTGALTIKPFPITITANNQSILYGSEPNLAVTETSKIVVVDEETGEEEEGLLLTVEISPAMYGNQTLIGRGSVEDGGLGLSLGLVNYDGTAGLHEGALVPAITNTNFDATIIPGNLLVVPAGDLLLSETDDDLAGKIAAANDGEDKVITFDDIAMQEKEWYAMVLPFATTPLELSTKLNTYVVVNVLKSSKIEFNAETNRDEAIVNFGIEMDNIDAGVPFLIKPAQAVNWQNAAPFNALVTEVITPATSAKATFSATYETGKSIKWGLELDGTTVNPDMKYRWLSHSTDGNSPTTGKPYGNAWYNCKSNAHDLLPMEAFLILDPAAQGARIFVEDFENGTTAIQSLNADEINGLKTSEGWYTIDGIKLQSAPVEKGVYINNGKKVVIK